MCEVNLVTRKYDSPHEYIQNIIDNHRLFVKKSWLGDFNGLFTSEAIRKDDIVCIYTGKICRTVEAMRIPVDEKNYLMRLGEQLYVDARLSNHVMARYINDCRNPVGYNVRFDKCPEERVAYVIALREIMPGEELFVDYGKWYWIGLTPTRLSLVLLKEKLYTLC